jgi:hypothetical protein
MPAVAVLAVLPLVLLAVAIYFRSAVGDFSGDPDYAYLLNALKVLQLRPPNHVDHPGTTVQILGGLIACVLWLARLPFNGWIPPVDDVLLHPEWYLGGIRLAFSALTCGALFALGWRIFRATGSLAASLVAQVSVSFSYPSMFFGLIEVGPEGLLLPLTLFLAAAIVPAAFASDARSASDPSVSSRTGVIVGVLIGACLVTKTNALPWIFIVFIFRERKIRIVAAATAVLAAIVITLPVASRYGNIIRYNLQMLTHVGPWGTGEPGIVVPGQHWTNIKGFFFDVPEVYLSFALCLALSLLISMGALRSDKFALTRLLTVSAAMQLAQVLIVTKEPRIHYIVPATAMVCLANGGIAFLLLQGGIMRRVTGFVIIAALIADGLWNGARVAVRAVRATGIERHDNRVVWERFTGSECKIIYAYENSSPPFKLVFGDHFAGSHYLRSIHRLYPSAVFYNERDRSFDTADGVLDSAAANAWVGRQGCVYLISSPLKRFTPEQFGISSGHVTLIDRSQHGMGSVAVYRINPAAAGESIFLTRP